MIDDGDTCTQLLNNMAMNTVDNAMNLHLRQCHLSHVTCPGKRTAWITTSEQWVTTLGTTRSHLHPTMQLLEAKDPTVRMRRCLGNILKLIFGFLNLKF